MSRAIIACIIIAIVVAYAIYQYALIARARSVGLPIAEATKPYEQHPVGAARFMLVLGDSTAVGVGAEHPNESIAGRIGARYPDADLTNLGESGAELQDMLDTQLPKVSRERYDLILLQIGANDVVYGDVGKVPERIQTALEWANTHADHVILMTAGNIGLSPVFKPPLSWYMSYRTRVVRADFIAAATKYTNVSYVDLYKNREDDPFTKNVPKYYAPDRFHPSGDGYASWFESVEKILPAL